MKNRRVIAAVIAAVLLCAVIITAAILGFDACSRNADAPVINTSDDGSISYNNYASEEEARIIEEAEKNGEIIFEGTQTFEDDDIPGDGNSVSISD